MELSGSISAGIYFALFRIIEIEELKGAEEAIEWARYGFSDPEFIEAFAEQVREQIASGKITVTGD